MNSKIILFSGVGYGGANNMVVSLSDYLTQKGYDTKTIFVLPKSEKNNPLLMRSRVLLGKEKIIFFWIKECKIPGLVGFYITLIRLFRIHRKAAKFIKDFNPTALISTHCRYTQSPFLLLFTGVIPTIFLFCEPKREFYEKTSFDHYSIKKRVLRVLLFPVKFLDKYNLRKNKENDNFKIITISKLSLKRLKDIYNLRGEVIYPSIDTEKFSSFKNKNKKTSKGLSLISVGSFNFHKGFDFLLKALSLLPEKMRSLTLIGNGGYDLDKIKKLGRELKINLKIQNCLSEKDLMKSYNNADLFLYAPRKEPFGIALFEAMSYGVPVVAVDEGGYAEILRKKGGRVFLSPRQARHFANKISEILENNRKYQNRKKLARKIALELPKNLFAGRIEKIIKKITR